MPNHRAASRWEHPTYRYAYVREYRGMACTVIHGSPPISTGYEWKPGSRTAALRILNERLEAYLHGGIAEQRTMTCAKLFEEFASVRFPRIAGTTQNDYARYMSALVPSGLAVTDTIRIRAAIARALEVSHYSQNSKRTAVNRVRSVFKFGIEQGWLTVNPVHPDMVPDEVVSEPEPYTDEDLAVAIDLLEGRNRAFVAFLMATGCRAGEACNLMWDAVHGDHIVIDGKRARSGRERLRAIPYVLCPDTPAVIDSARGADWSSPERVFGVSSYRAIGRAFNSALPGGGRGFHDIRKWRINAWVRMGWPESLIEAVAGHGLAVSKKHYRTRFTAADLVSMALDSGVDVGP